MRRRLAGLLLLAVSAVVSDARAQQQPTAGLERIQIGLSTNVVRINADFSGADLTIFGSLDNADPMLSRQARYDVVVVLEGPGRPVTVRKKQRVLGIWMNTSSEQFVNVPESYEVSTTRALQDIAEPATYERLGLGPENIRIQPSASLTDPGRIADFTAALRTEKKAAGLYGERIGGVQFLSPSLFRASVFLAPDIPVGTHRARAFLFKDGVYLGESAAPLVILKAGFEQMLFRLAHGHSTFFGFLAVGLAVVTGWLGRMLFKRD